ncbi:uncharacterized protein J8A68_005962 [[Candida] subhashii]|uniref:Uncharacterized protein n=1 Tax=[Candida] subhashii TaxID=561895 RepID=A0A8J5UDR7_9ASCO|nr:uncharacterized protein J8A68_005962 [[Candida] subhashii]KAG7660543.1 hypothetical protein J8A68_005962 [[Candida] subhashii]
MTLNTKQKAALAGLAKEAGYDDVEDYAADHLSSNNKETEKEAYQDATTMVRKLNSLGTNKSKSLFAVFDSGASWCVVNSVEYLTNVRYDLTASQALFFNANDEPLFAYALGDLELDIKGYIVSLKDVTDGIPHNLCYQLVKLQNVMTLGFIFMIAKWIFTDIVLRKYY